MINLKLILFCSMTAGTFATVITLALVEHLREPSLTERPAASSSDTEPADPSPEQSKVYVVQTDAEQLRALRADVAQLKADRETNAPPPPSLPPDPVEGRKQAEATFAALEQQHRNDPEDPKWAPVASAALESGLIQLSTKHGFLVRSVECKTTFCRASLDWKDFASAQAAGAVLAETAFGDLNCVQSVRLNTPKDPRKVYSTDLYLDCTSLRAGTVEVASAPE